MNASFSTTPSADDVYARAGYGGTPEDRVDAIGMGIASRAAANLESSDFGLAARLDPLAGWESDPGPGVERFSLARDFERADMTFHELRQAVFEGTIHPETVLIRRGPPATELRAIEVPGLFSRKSRALCAVLAVLFGVFGADRIYVGHVGLGFTKGLIFVLGLLSVAASYVLGGDSLARHLTEPSIGAMLLHGGLGWAFLDLLLLLIGGLRFDGDGVPIAWR
jgi:hypothetical protein